MLDWEVNLISKEDRHHFLLSYIEEDATISVTTKISSMEMRAVETLINADHQDYGRPRPVLSPSPHELDHVSTVLVSISPTLDNALIYDSLRYRDEMGNFKSSIGSTNVTTSQLLVDNNTKAIEPSTDNDFSVDCKYILDDL